MQILELESKTGLDRATIRHYEKEGLISPTRRDNGYRDYTEENVNDLLKIKLLRQLGLSLDKIRRIKQGSDSFSDTLAEQIRILQQQIDLAQRAKDVCHQMLKDNVTYATMDAQGYIDQLTQPRNLTLPKQFHEPVLVRPFHPVRRYVARMLDYTLISVLLFLLIFVVFRVRPAAKLLTTVLSYAAPVLALPILAFILSKFGTTPGKWLMGLEVYSVYGGKMHFDAAFSRELEVFTRGYGLGIPLVSPIFEVINYRKYAHQDPDWDRYCEYIYHPWTKKRKIAFVMAVLMVFMSLFVAFSDLLKPKYRGDLTISEFCSNYNDYLDTIGDISPEYYLNDDGTWHELDELQLGVIVVGSETQVDPLEFQLKGETVTGLRYHKTWTGLQLPVDPMNTVAQVLMINTLMSQRGTGYTDMMDFLEQLEAQENNQKGSIVCGNVEVTWRIETENCKQVGNFDFLAENDELDASMELFLEIEIR